jgi:hypothetical protein
MGRPAGPVPAPPSCPDHTMCGRSRIARISQARRPNDLRSRPVSRERCPRAIRGCSLGQAQHAEFARGSLRLVHEPPALGGGPALDVGRAREDRAPAGRRIARPGRTAAKASIPRSSRARPGPSTTRSWPPSWPRISRDRSGLRHCPALTPRPPAACSRPPSAAPPLRRSRRRGSGPPSAAGRPPRAG